MALGKIDPKKLWQGLKKYRYAALVLLLGLALLLLPGGKKTTPKSNAAASAAQTDYAKAAVAATTYPRFQGALIVCEGADSAAVRLRLLEAVSAVTGLSTDRITVVKMRS